MEGRRKASLHCTWKLIGSPVPHGQLCSAAFLPHLASQWAGCRGEAEGLGQPRGRRRLRPGRRAGAGEAWEGVAVVVCVGSLPHRWTGRVGAGRPCVGIS